MATSTLAHASPAQSVAAVGGDPVRDMFREMSVCGDPVASRRLRDAIVEHYLPLADDLARRFNGRGELPDDLVQVARVGLVKAVSRFDVDLGSDFVSFAVPTVVGEIRRHFRDNGWSVKVPRRVKELTVRLGSVTGELAQRLGRAPTASELAAEMEIERDEVLDGLLAGSCYRSLSLHAEAAGVVGILDTLGDADLALDHVEYRELLRPLLSALPERERTVLLLRFFGSLTQTEIAERVGISQMHVSRLLARSLKQLRETLSPEWQAA